MANELIRKYAKENGVPLYAITHELGYKSANYSTIYFRYELDEVKQKEIFELIDKIASNKKSLMTVGSNHKAN